MLNNLMTHRSGFKKNRKIFLQINSSHFCKMVLHNSRNKAQILKNELQCERENLDVNID